MIDATGARGRSLAIDIGDGTLVNAGVIEATGAAQLVIETGVMANSGEVDAAGAGRLELAGVTIDQTGAGVFAVSTRAFLKNASVSGGAIDIVAGGLLVVGGASNVSNLSSATGNDGRLEVVGGTLTVNGAVTGTGLGVIAGGVLAFTASFEERVQFLKGAGTLRLGQSQSYTGAVFGFAANSKTALDLRDIGFVGANEASFSGTASKGVLTVTDGTQTARITLIGDYLGDTFTAASDGAGGTTITASAAPGSRTLLSALASAHADQEVRAPLVLATHGFMAAAAGLGPASAAESRTVMETRAASTSLGLARPALA